MHDDNARTSDFVVEIRDAVGPIGNAGGKGIRPVVSIIDDGVAGTRGRALSLSYPLFEIFVMAFFALGGGLRHSRRWSFSTNASLRLER